MAALAGAARPRVPLIPLLLAAYAADGVEILLHAVGTGHANAMLWSHSVTALLVGGLAASLIGAVTLRRLEAAVVVGLVYASHGLCDFLTGEQKPTWDGGPTYGLGLYQQPAADFMVEISLVLLAAAVYRWRRQAHPRRLIAAVALLTVLQLGFNLGDRAWLHGLKSDLVRATSAARAPAAAPRQPADASQPAAAAWLLHTDKRLLPRVHDAR